MKVLLPTPLLVAETDTATFWQEGYTRTSTGSDPFGYAMVGDRRVEIPYLWSALTRIGVEMVAEVVEGLPLEKARQRQFSSRSEAGRYAAQIRWGRRNGQQPNATGEEMSEGAKQAGLWTEWTDDPLEAVEGKPYRPLMDLPSDVKAKLDAYEDEIYSKGDMSFTESRRVAEEALALHYLSVFTDPNGPPWNEQARKATGVEFPEEFAAGLAQHHIQKVGDFAYFRSFKDHGLAAAAQVAAGGKVGVDPDWKARRAAGDLFWTDHASVIQSSSRTSVVVSIPKQVLTSLVSDERLKSQFETGQSSGYIGYGDKRTLMRATHEALEFGFHPAADPAKRPVYGTLMPAGVISNTLNRSEQYGSVMLVLKPQVRARTTFTPTDSLGGHKQGNSLVPHGKPRPAVLPSGSTREQRRAFEAKTGQRVASHDYVETQIHGGVRLADVATVYVPKSAAFPAETMRALEAAGITIAAAGGQNIAKAAALDMRTVVIQALNKARERRFGSRSEAGRYAAQVRWGNQGADAKPAAPTKTQDLRTLEQTEAEATSIINDGYPDDPNDLFTEEEQLAAEDYMGASTWLNSDLRRGEIDDDYADTVYDLESAIAKAPPLKQAAVVYRGLDTRRMDPKVVAKFQNLKVGQQFEDDGFCSTSVRAGVAARFAGSITMVVALPAGTRALSMDKIVGIVSGRKESEVVLDRGTRFKVLGKSQTESGKTLLRVTPVEVGLK